jgi:hypothetical protein
MFHNSKSFCSLSLCSKDIFQLDKIFIAPFDENWLDGLTNVVFSKPANCVQMTRLSFVWVHEQIVLSKHLRGHEINS